MNASIEFVVSIFPYLCLIEILRKKNKLFVNNSLFYVIVTFGVYMTAMFHFTDPSTLYDLLYYRGKIFYEYLNLHPFSTGISQIGYGLNVVLFIPFGFLVPVLFKMKARWIETIGCGFATSLGIEISQLFNTRISDVDDLIMNSTGVLIGYLLYKILERRLPAYKLPLRYLLSFILILYAGRFFLYPYIT